jgi:hypothetical protein
MRKLACVLLPMIFVSFAVVFAADFKPYPGAKTDEKATKQARDGAVAAKTPDVKPTIYTTSDSFGKVASFYKGIAKEYVMPRASGTSGKPKKLEGFDLWEAYFILDGAKDLATSKLWIKVQRPYIGSTKMGKDFKVQYEDVRDVTAIVVSEKK